MTNEEYELYKQKRVEWEETKRVMKSELSEEEYADLIDEEEENNNIEKTRSELDEMFSDGAYLEMIEYMEDNPILDENGSIVNKEEATLLKTLSPFHHNFGRIKMIVNGTTLPVITFFFLLMNTKDMVSSIGIESSWAGIGIIITIPLAMILTAIFKRSRDINENPYFNMIVLFIPLVNLYLLIGLYLTKGVVYNDLDYDDLD